MLLLFVTVLLGVANSEEIEVTTTSWSWCGDDSASFASKAFTRGVPDEVLVCLCGLRQAVLVRPSAPRRRLTVGCGIAAP